MTDDLERRLEQLGSARTPAMSALAVDELEQRLLAGHRRQFPWRPLLATAAAVILLAGAVFAFRRTDNDSLRPATTAATSTVAATAASTTVAPTTSAPTTTIAPTTTALPTTTAPESTVPGGLPPEVPMDSTTSVTVPPATAPPTAPPSSPPPTSQPPATIPPASFTLTVQRVGDQLVFTWPRYTGADGRQYVLVRVGPAGLTNWPVGPSRIARIVARMNVTSTAIDQPAVEQSRWVLAVVGENRTLLAVSSVAFSA